MGPLARTSSIGWYITSVFTSFLPLHDHAIRFNTHAAGAGPIGHAMKHGVRRQHCYSGRLRNRLD